MKPGLIRPEIFLLIIGFLARSLEALNPERSGTVPLIFDDDRVFAELNFVRPNGTLRKALAFVDLGTPTLVLDKKLHEELQTGQGKPVILRVGDLDVRVESSAVDIDTRLGFTGRDVTLEKRSDGSFVSGIAEKAGKPTVDAVRVGDKLIQVDGVLLSGATRGAIFTALHGEPGSIRTLVLERDGRQLTLPAKVTAF